jgi:O-antigen/teichoic acid export membrane protein
MALVTVVGLFTSRVILQMLGVEDFGIYTVAGSAVALFSFLTGALAQSSSRYITVEIGKVVDDNIDSLVRCFKTTRAIHGILAILIFVLCETLGLIILHKSSIPEERMTAAFWCFQISTLTALVNVTQIPFNSLIIAHERMSVFAYVSIFEVFAKLLVCYLLIISPIDKMVFYAVLLFIVQLSVFVMYRLYCSRHFQECSMGYKLDKEFFRPIMSFSFWNLFGSLSFSALTQGTTILISFFFGPALVASRSIANQVKNHVTSFVTNFRTAINPQIIKDMPLEILNLHAHYYFSLQILLFT